MGGYEQMMEDKQLDLKRLRKMVKSFEEQPEDMVITYDFLVNSFFSTHKSVEQERVEKAFERGYLKGVRGQRLDDITKLNIEFYREIAERISKEVEGQRDKLKNCLTFEYAPYWDAQYKSMMGLVGKLEEVMIYAQTLLEENPNDNEGN